MIRNSIVLVPFPFDDFSTIKVRPALCLTNEVGKFNHVIIAFISSKISSNIEESEIIISKESIDGIGTGLTKDSIIKLHKMVAVPRGFIKRKIGGINEHLQEKVAEKLRRVFEL